MSTSDEQPGRNPRRHGQHDPRGAGGDEVPSITSVPESFEDEQSRRMHVYLIQMLIRVACFVGAVVVTNWPIRIVLIAGAVVLPYTAVIFANAGGERRSSGGVGMEHRELPAAPDQEQPRVIDVPPPDDEPHEHPHGSDHAA